jgi:hypothetical protein
MKSERLQDARSRSPASRFRGFDYILIIGSRPPVNGKVWEARFLGPPSGYRQAATISHLPPNLAQGMGVQIRGEPRSDEADGDAVHEMVSLLRRMERGMWCGTHQGVSGGEVSSGKGGRQPRAAQPVPARSYGVARSGREGEKA